MKPKTLVFFTIRDEKMDEVKSALQQFLKDPGVPVHVFVVPYTNRFVALVDQDVPAKALDKLVQFLTPRFKELPEFIELEPVASRR